MTRKMEKQRLEIKVYSLDDPEAKQKLAELKEKDNKSKARFLIFNEGRQKELKRRIKEIALEKRRYQEKKRMEAHKQAMANLNDFATEHNLKD